MRWFLVAALAVQRRGPQLDDQLLQARNLAAQFFDGPVLARDGIAQGLDRQLLVREPNLQVLDECLAAQASQRRALRNRRRQGASSYQPSGRQVHCTARTTRSGCGIMMVKRPSALVRPVMPSGEPFGLAG